jgi:hypothetical protein
MESKKETNINDKIPKERRKRTKETEGKLDDDGYFYTPNGSFWDMDGEYFNRHGFDIHGGKYVNKLDYIPGPTWIAELGCYPEDEEQYKKGDIDDDDIEDLDEKDLEILEGEVKGINISDNVDVDLGALGINENKIKELLDSNEKKEINNNLINNKKNKKNKNKKKNKKKKEESFDEDEWEEIED